MYEVHPSVSKFVIQKLILFTTTLLCETGFSAMCILKTKHRNQLEVEDLQLGLPQWQIKGGANRATAWVSYP